MQTSLQIFLPRRLRDVSSRMPATKRGPALIGHACTIHGKPFASKNRGNYPWLNVNLLPSGVGRYHYACCIYARVSWQGIGINRWKEKLSPSTKRDRIGRNGVKSASIRKLSRQTASNFSKDRPCHGHKSREDYRSRPRSRKFQGFLNFPVNNLVETNQGRRRRRVGGKYYTRKRGQESIPLSISSYLLVSQDDGFEDV